MQRHEEKLCRAQQHVHPLDEAEVLRKSQSNLGFLQELTSPAPKLIQPILQEYKGLSYPCISAGRTISGFIWRVLFWKLWKPFGVGEVLVRSLVEDFPSASFLCTHIRSKKKQTIWNFMYLLILKCLFRQFTKLKYRKRVWARSGLSIFPSLRGGVATAVSWHLLSSPALA